MLFKKENKNSNIPEFYYKKEYRLLFEKYNIDYNNLLFYDVPENYLINFFKAKELNDNVLIDDLMYFSDDNIDYIIKGFEPNSISDLKDHKIVFENIDTLLKGVSTQFIIKYIDNLELMLKKKSFLEIFSYPNAEAGLIEIFDNEYEFLFKELPVKKIASNLTFFTKINMFKDYPCYFTIINYLTNLPLNKKHKVLDYMLSITNRISNVRYVDMFIRVYIDNEKYTSNIDGLLTETNVNKIESCLYTSEVFPKLVDSNFKDKLYTFLSPVEKETVFISSFEHGIGSIKERVLEINRRDLKYEPYINYLELFYNFNYTDEDFTKLLYLSKRKQFKKFLKVLFEE